MTTTRQLATIIDAAYYASREAIAHGATFTVIYIDPTDGSLYVRNERHRWAPR